MCCAVINIRPHYRWENKKARAGAERATSFNATEMQVATRDGFGLRRARAFGALKMATRKVAGTTRDGSIEQRPDGAEEFQVGVM